MCPEPPHPQAGKIILLNGSGRLFTPQELIDEADVEMWIWSTLQIAFAAGLATTFDDTIYLTGFFGEVNRDFRPRHVIVGEVIGFSALLAISLVGYSLGLALPRDLVGLLGLLPIAIGCRGLSEELWLRLRKDIPAAQPEKASQRDRISNVAPGFRSRRPSLWQLLRDRQTYDVAVVAVANGSNNLSIYIPLFASLTLPKVMVVIPVLYGFIATWLFLAFALTRTPGIALVLHRYARPFFPLILIWLGLRILSDSGAWQRLLTLLYSSL